MLVKHVRKNEPVFNVKFIREEESRANSFLKHPPPSFPTYSPTGGAREGMGGGAWGSEGLACISTRNEKFACASEAPGRKTALDTSEGDFIPA